MKNFTLAVLGLLLAGCQTAATHDESSIWFEVPAGSKLVLVKALDIPEGESLISLQKGQSTGNVDQYLVNCKFEVEKPGPQTVHPGTFKIMRSSSQQEWVITTRSHALLPRISPAREAAGCDQVGVPALERAFAGKACQITEIQQALGDYFTFAFAH